MSWHSLSNSLLLLLPLHPSPLKKKKFAWGASWLSSDEDSTSSAGYMGLIPYGETNILHAEWGSDKKKKKGLTLFFVYGLNPLLF